MEYFTSETFLIKNSNKNSLSKKGGNKTYEFKCNF